MNDAPGDDAIDEIKDIVEVVASPSPYEATHIYHDLKAGLSALSLVEGDEDLAEQAAFISNELE